MKKSCLFLCLCCLTFGYSQEKQQENALLRKNELKLNAAFLIAGAFEVSYERIIDDESAFGTSLFLTANDDISNKFMLTPYYRYYFGRKPAAGFFAEGFGSINTYENKIYNYLSSLSYDYRTEKTTDFALGFGLGGKWITKKGVVFEIYSGVGRNLINSDNSDFQIIGRGAISVGYRFN
jgi:hypothetical protein